MPAISRDRRDLAKTGHPCTKFIGCIATVGTVYANGSKVLRPGDPLLPHTILVCAPKCRCVKHPAVVWGSSRTVFAEGKPVSRRGDGADMGSMIQGSGDVFAG